MAFSLCLSPSYPDSNVRKAKVDAPPIAASARLYFGRQLLQAKLSGPRRACLVSHPWQLVPYAALGFGRDRVNNLGSFCLEPLMTRVPTYAIFCVLFIGHILYGLLVRAWERPTCSHMASTHTAYDCPPAHTLHVYIRQRGTMNNERPHRLDQPFDRPVPLLSSPGNMCV